MNCAGGRTKNPPGKPHAGFLARCWYVRRSRKESGGFFPERCRYEDPAQALQEQPGAPGAQAMVGSPAVMVTP